MDKKVLIVEDDTDIVSFIKEGLEAEGFEVQGTRTVSDAMEIMQGNHVDLVILDLILPGGTGYSLCKAMRGDEKYRDIPIIILTVRNTKEAKLAAEKSGANEFIAKPFKMAHLIDKVKEHLVQRGQGGQSAAPKNGKEVKEHLVKQTQEGKTILKASKKHRVLVIEDEPDIVEAIRERLEREGYQVLGASNVDDAWKTIRATSVDLVLLDILLFPDQKSGYAFLNEWRKEERYRDIPIFVITGRASQDAREITTALGVAEFIPKPFKMNDLLAKIEKYLKEPAP